MTTAVQGMTMTAIPHYATFPVANPPPPPISPSSIFKMFVAPFLVGRMHHNQN